MRILFVSSEVYPLAKVGGLGDVACALPKALRKLGHDVRIVMPKYEWIKSEDKIGDISVDFHGHKMVSVELTNVDGVPVYLLGNDEFFGGKVVYQGGKEETLKFAFFSKAVAELIKDLDFKPQIVHCNDWHNALAPLHLKLLRDKTPTVFTVHNLKYQGTQPGLTLGDIGLPKNASDVLGKRVVNPMKGGILYSDIVSTVSKTYAKEIQTKEYGCGLDGVLRKRARELYGIVNGLDYDVWNPEKDGSIYQKYNGADLGGKLKNKRHLLEEVGLPANLEVPLAGMVCRLDPSKGLDLVVDILPKILAGGKINFVLLGTGTPKYHKIFEEMAGDFPNAKAFLRFDELLAHKIYAGSDIFLMPSLFEPCGLGQLISLKYGTIPVVRKTGGLADTIIDFDGDRKKGNGFVFKKPTSVALGRAIRRALAVHRRKKIWEGLVKRAMGADYSWVRSAREYVKLYQILCLKKIQET